MLYVGHQIFNSISRRDVSIYSAGLKVLRRHSAVGLLDWEFESDGEGGNGVCKCTDRTHLPGVVFVVIVRES